MSDRMELARAYVGIEADASRFPASVKKQQAQVTGALTGFASSVNSIMSGIGISFGLNAIINMFRGASSAGEESVEVMERMAAMVDLAGGRAKVSVDQIEEWISKIYENSTVDDEALRNATTNLLKYEDLQGDMIRRTLQAATDMSAVSTTFRSVEAAAQALGRAMQYPTSASRILKQAGVELNDQEKAYLKTLEASKQGQVAAAFILAKIEEKYGGKAAEMAKTALGRRKQAARAADDLKEDMGKMMIGINTFIDEIKVSFYSAMVTIGGYVVPVIDQIANLNAMLGGTPVKIMIIVGTVLALAEAFVLVKDTLAHAIGSLTKIMKLNPFGIWLYLIGAVVVGLVYLVNKISESASYTELWENTLDKLYVAWTAIKEAAITVWEAIKGVFSSIVSWIERMTGQTFPEMGNSFMEVFANMLSTVSYWIMDVSEWIQAIVQNFQSVWDAIGLGLQVALSYMGDIWYNWCVKFLPQAAGWGLAKLVDLFNWLVKTINELIWKMIFGIVEALANIPKMIWDYMTGVDVENVVKTQVAVAKKEMDDAASAFRKGWAGKAPNIADVFVAREGTRALAAKFADQIQPVFDAKAKLAASRSEIAARRKAKEEEKKKPGGGEEDKWKGYNFSELAGKRMGFADLGKQIQDIMLKQAGGGDPQLGTMIQQNELGNKLQEKQLKELGDIKEKVGGTLK